MGIRVSKLNEYTNGKTYNTSNKLALRGTTEEHMMTHPPHITAQHTLTEGLVGRG